MKYIAGLFFGRMLLSTAGAVYKGTISLISESGESRHTLKS
jgi:hypothetical protein